MKNLDELLEQLKSEPEFDFKGTRRSFEDAKAGIYRARLLACVEALEMALHIAKLMPSRAYTRIMDRFKIDELPNEMQADYDTAEQDIIAKLAAALETK